MSMKMYDLYRNVVMYVSTLERKGDDLVMKGKIMGTMPTTIYLKPEEVWQAKSLLSWSIIWYLPVLMIKGWRQSRKQHPQKS
jgi:hypothetical protein